MASKYRGVIRIGDKASGKATDLEVVDLSGNRLSLKLIDYVNSGAELSSYPPVARRLPIDTGTAQAKLRTPP